MKSKHSQSNPAQERFDEKYITASEIARETQVSRPSVFRARVRGLLPDPVDVEGKIYIWERDTVRPYIDAWKIILAAKRNHAA